MKSKTTALMEVQNIELSYATYNVISDLSTTIYSGSFIGLIGPNGAGKSTLLRALSGQFKPQNGNILFENYDIYQRNLKFKHEVGYVDENPFFFPYLNVEEFLSFIARIKKVRKNEIEPQISSVLKSVCLHNERQELTSNLSMGMRKKLAIATALLGSPKIIFLDEALNGVDIESAFKIKSVLNTLVANGTTIIISTHILEIIEKICDRYLVLKNGKIIVDLTSDNFKEFDTIEEHIDLETYVIQILKD